MTDAIVTASLVEIEDRCAVADVRYDGIAIWPLVRFLLWGEITRRYRPHLAAASGAPAMDQRPAPSRGGRRLARDLRPVSSIPGLLADPSLPSIPPPADLLFFVREEEHVEQVDGRGYAKILDSLATLLRPEHALVKLELLGEEGYGERQLPTWRLPQETLLASGWMPGDVSRLDPNYSELTGAIRSVGLTPPSPADIARWMCFIQHIADRAGNILQALSPRILLLSCYYHPIGMGLMLACRQAGIVSVDVQHGRLGPYHGLYTQFTQVPADGYALMPDHIWCWNTQTIAAIADGRSDNVPRHRGILGGNPWLSLWTQGEGLPVAEADKRLFAERTIGRRLILVSLQPADNPLPDSLLTAIRRAPADWLWLIRVHPLRRQNMVTISGILADLADQVEIEQATDLPLFWLLRRVSCHVTLFSSVAIEAAQFGVPTVLIDPEGAVTFADHIRSGRMFYERTAEDILTRLHQLSAGPDQCFDMIEARCDTARQTMRTILETASATIPINHGNGVPDTKSATRPLTS